MGNRKKTPPLSLVDGRRKNKKKEVPFGTPVQEAKGRPGVKIVAREGSWKPKRKSLSVEEPLAGAKKKAKIEVADDAQPRKKRETVTSTKNDKPTKLQSAGKKAKSQQNLRQSLVHEKSKARPTKTRKKKFQPKAKKPSSQEAEVPAQFNELEFFAKTKELYLNLQRIYSSHEHQIVNRNEEEQAILEFIKKAFASKKGSLLYACGHPGVGKTALVTQVLHDHFEASEGGDENLVKFEYNANQFKSLGPFLEALALAIVRDGMARSRLPLTSKLTNFKSAEKAASEQLQQATSVELQSQCIASLFHQHYRLGKDAKKSKLRFLIFLDEIDNFSSTRQEKEAFWTFLKLLMMDKRINPVFIGIANSVDLIKGTSIPHQLLVFDPYTKADLGQIMVNLFLHEYSRKLGELRAYFEDVFALLEKDQRPKGMVGSILKFIHQKAFEHCSKDVERESGDLRKCFEIMKGALQAKVRVIESACSKEETKEIEADPPKALARAIETVQIRIGDIQAVLEEKFASRLDKIVTRVPFSYLVVLRAVEDEFREGLRTGSSSDITQSRIMSRVNKQYVGNLGLLDRLQISELKEILEFLQTQGVLSVTTARERKKSDFLSSKQVRSPIQTSNFFNVRLQVDLDELSHSIAKVWAKVEGS